MVFEFNNLVAVGAEIEQKAARVPRKWAVRVVSWAKGFAPVRTRFMKEHIVDTSTDEEGSAEAQASYSGFVNFGTVHMHANPFFSQAIEQANGEMAGVVSEAFGEGASGFFGLGVIGHTSGDGGDGAQP